MGGCLRQVKYKVICEALDNQIECGDQYFIKKLDDFILFAVIDGLGHGKKAEEAAKLAIKTLDAHANESIESLFKLCHEALIKTRGAAMTLVKIDVSYKLTYIAIGNVLGVCWKIDENYKLKHHSFFLEGGIVGAQLPSLMRVREIAMAPGDIFILATDGIKAQFENEAPILEKPDQIAKRIFETYRNKKDDALVLVAQLF
jgi:phosphoserine phosphatase RsbX